MQVSVQPHEKKLSSLEHLKQKKKQNKNAFLTDCPIKMPQDCTNKEKDFFLTFFS